MQEKIFKIKKRLESELKLELAPPEECLVGSKAPVNKASLCEMIDHTLLKPEAARKNYIALFEEARKYGFYSVCIPPVQVEFAARELQSDAVKICTVVGFPLGYSTTNTKITEAKESMILGADEIDMVMNVSALKSFDYELVLNEIKAIKDSLNKNIKLKVIIETALLDETEKYAAAWIVKAAGADYIKTSTGFSGKGATIEDVKLLKSIAGKDMGVKASGGIKSYEQAMSMIEAGASRLGVSSSVEIIEGEKGLFSQY
ncbi:MAG: deoxyribose-phosphate aldolase [Tindallia sp. MSAO_Bac2]|nr:MAG: deoxyribose-phosphate aldolase [Tindallia sp. MSAO_Bac2]